MEEEGEQGYPYRGRKPAYDSSDPAVEEDYTSRHRTQKPFSEPMQEEEEEEGHTYKTHRPTHPEQQQEEEEEEENRNTRKPSYNAMQRKEEYEEEKDYSTEKVKPTHTKEASSSSDMLSSAKYLAEATQHMFRHETDMIDRSRVAGAAEDVLQSASRYGKLDEKGFGQYIDKAESYLHQYHSSSSHAPGGHGGGDQSSQPSHDDGGGGGGGGGGGYGDYLKMAEGFFKKN